MSELSKNAITVLERRYLSKDENGTLTETPDQMFHRVANAVAEADKLYSEDADTAAGAQEFYEVMRKLLFMPNSPTLMNAGKPLGQLSACFVLPIGDSMDEIFDSVKNAALIHKSGGGTGFAFSRLRPSGSSVRSTGGVASGPVSFMKVFNSATEAVKQGGTRRGANMGILRVDHPDILNFIGCKSADGEISNFNISVGLTEAFMEAVEQNSTYALVNPATKKVEDELNAREVFELIVDHAWRNGEPGIVFLDRMNRDNVIPHMGEIESTNPCGEQPLLPYESCNLGSLNLARMLKEERAEDGRASYRVDFDLLGNTIDTAVHFLDNVIDVNRFPLEQIRETTQKTRKIGLGVMGFADMLYRLGIPYNSEEGIAMANRVMEFINQRAHEASEKLAQVRGAFPEFARSTLSSDKPIRNATCTTIAPTGTISIICSASSGIEPLFALSFVRNVMDNDELPQVDPYFEEVARQEGFYSPELMRQIAKVGTLAHIEGIPEHIKHVFVTAHDISPKYHIRMQSAFQRHTDNAVSKTVNFPNSATREEVYEVFMLAYKLGCKGVTIYRDGSRDNQVLYAGDKKAETQPEPQTPVLRVTPRPRPEVTRGITEKIVIGCGNLYVTVNYDDEGICEVFTNLGRAGGCPSQSEATSRLVSTALRSGMDVDSIIEQLKGIRCHATLRQRTLNKNNIKVLSCPDAIGRVLEKVAKLRAEQQDTDAHQRTIQPAVDAESAPLNPYVQEAEVPEELVERLGTSCPDCGSVLEHEGGCVICRTCGYSKCG